MFFGCFFFLPGGTTTGFSRTTLNQVNQSSPPSLPDARGMGSGSTAGKRVSSRLSSETISVSCRVMVSVIFTSVSGGSLIVSGRIPEGETDADETGCEFGSRAEQWMRV